MNRSLEKQAKEFAELPYIVKISKDKTIDGGSVFLASHPELIGCMAQGVTVEEAVESLREVTYEYILSILEDKMPVPVPQSKTMTSVEKPLVIEETVMGNKPFIDILSDSIQPSTREDVSTVECVSCP